jgi:hypothetical protein
MLDIDAVDPSTVILRRRGLNAQRQHNDQSARKTVPHQHPQVRTEER